MEYLTFPLVYDNADNIVLIILHQPHTPQETHECKFDRGFC